MKTSLENALGDPDSKASLSSSYQVPATDGRLVLANPLKFCLSYRQPMIAVVYTLEKSKKTSKNGKPRKYIHEINVDFESCMDKSRPQKSPLEPNKPTLKEVEALCRKLCDKEPTYLNINVISKTQVLNLLTKLYEKKYKCAPPESPKAVSSGAAPGAPENKGLMSKKPQDADQISDDYDDDFDDDNDLHKKPSPKAKKEAEKKEVAAAKKDIEDDYEDDWDMDNWGELDSEREKAKPGLAALSKPDKKQSDEKKKQDLYFGGGSDDVLDLDGLPDVMGKDEDKFNQVMSSSKEKGGLLASIGLKKDDVAKDDSIAEESPEEDPHKKSDLFDTSKDRIAQNKAKKPGAARSDEEDFDLGFGSSKKSKEGGPGNKSGAAGEFGKDAAAYDMDAEGMSDEDGAITEEQEKAIEEQFKLIYEKDPELRKQLEMSDVKSFSVLEKYQIIEAYMQNGAAGLQIELEDEEEDVEKAVAEMSSEDIAQIEEKFAELYQADPELQGVISSVDSISVAQKYSILLQYQNAGSQSMADQYMSGDDNSMIMHEGKRYRRVQIEGTDGDHLMDEEQNIYTLDFKKIGQAGDSDEDDDF